MAVAASFLPALVERCNRVHRRPRSSNDSPDHESFPALGRQAAGEGIRHVDGAVIPTTAGIPTLRPPWSDRSTSGLRVHPSPAEECNSRRNSPDLIRGKKTVDGFRLLTR